MFGFKLISGLFSQIAKILNVIFIVDIRTVTTYCVLSFFYDVNANNRIHTFLFKGFTY
ncbi:MAG TPA: DUF1328 domain-containing protein [Nitrospirae bacterium]|nr:DUF1328 domain-containing protein [Nitrospirota bacterium]